ncbi:MAG TPA: hypothetical protein ENJ38_10210 [Rhodospirillales bacterium]|nr:hypothetical protein [Rhodospirillales bacterium]
MNSRSPSKTSAGNHSGRDRRRPPVPLFDTSSLGLAAMLTTATAVVAGLQAVGVGADGFGGWLSITTTVLASLGAAFAWRAGNRVRKIARVCTAAAQGDLQQRVVFLGDRGLLRALARDVNRLSDLGDTFVRELGQTLGHVANNQYYRRILVQGLSGDYARWAGIANEQIERIAERSKSFQQLTGKFEAEVKSVADDVGATADRLGGIAREVGQASEESAGNVQNVAAAVEELTASVQDIASNATLSADVVRSAAAEAEQSREAAARLTETAEQIASVVGTIRDIAEQTNLLALNATIEAAHAGEAGKGFAVVAGEVKTLASQTGNATETIRRRAEEMREVIGEVTAVLGRIAARVGEADTAASSIASAVEQQAAVVQDIARRMDEVSRAVGTVTAAVGSMEATSEDKTLAAAVADLDTRAKALREQIDGFLQAARQVA